MRGAIVPHDVRMVDREVFGALFEVVGGGISDRDHHLFDEPMGLANRLARIIDEAALNAGPRGREARSRRVIELAQVKTRDPFGPRLQRVVGTHRTAIELQRSLVFRPEALAKRRTPSARLTRHDPDEYQRDRNPHEHDNPQRCSLGHDALPFQRASKMRRPARLLRATFMPCENALLMKDGISIRTHRGAICHADAPAGGGTALDDIAIGNACGFQRT
jgi:hypothetical protein